MGREELRFENIDAIEHRLRHLGPDAAYLRIWDRSDRTRERSLARLELDGASGDQACRWLRMQADQHSTGRPWRRFRVRVYGPKGLSLLATGTFVCRRPIVPTFRPRGDQ